jgi:2'-5' RNA ligase
VPAPVPDAGERRRETVRTFVALPIPQESQKALDKAQGLLRATKADVRWISAASIHLTLKFLGEIDPETLLGITRALRESVQAHGRFTLCLRGLGAFPGLVAPRIVWCGIEGETHILETLQKDVESVCARFGFPREQRVFRPHLTLGRVRGKRNLQRLVECIKITSVCENSFEATGINLYKSTLTPGGAVYDVLERLPLGRLEGSGQ